MESSSNGVLSFVSWSKSKSFVIQRQKYKQQHKLKPQLKIYFVTTHNNSVVTMRRRQGNISAQWEICKKMLQFFHTSASHLDQFLSCNLVIMAMGTKLIKTSTKDTRILRPFLGWQYCFHGDFLEIRDCVTEEKRYSDQTIRYLWSIDNRAKPL